MVVDITHASPVIYYIFFHTYIQECLGILAARCASCNAWHTSSAHLCNPAGGYIRWGIDSHHWYWFVARHLQRWESFHIWYNIMSRNMQQIFEHIFDRLYVGYSIHIKSREIIILFSMCRYAQSCAFISVIELPRIPAYCPKMPKSSPAGRCFQRLLLNSFQ